MSDDKVVPFEKKKKPSGLPELGMKKPPPGKPLDEMDDDEWYWMAWHGKLPKKKPPPPPPPKPKKLTPYQRNKLAMRDAMDQALMSIVEKRLREGTMTRTLEWREERGEYVWVYTGKLEKERD